MEVSNPTARCWTFTFNNFKDNGWTDWQHYIKNIGEVTYLVCEEEVGEQGTPHLQGFVHFKNRHTFKSLHKFFNGHAHIEIARGSDESNRKYCTKENCNVLEIGKPANELKQNKWETLVDDYDKMDFNTFYHKYPKESVLHLRHLIELSNAKYQDQDQTIYEGSLKSKNLWIYGEPGTGKSRWARKQTPSIYLKSVNKWWSGYNHKYQMVLMEDFPCFEQSKGALGQHMKLWADRYTFTAETKGGHVFIHPKDYVFVVTSNYSIDQCFAPGDAEAIKRRFTEIMIIGQDDIFFNMIMEVSDILRGNCSEEHAVHNT